MDKEQSVVLLQVDTPTLDASIKSSYILLFPTYDKMPSNIPKLDR